MAQGDEPWFGVILAGARNRTTGNTRTRQTAGTRQENDIIEMACDVANLRLGRDLIINLTITSGDSGSGMRNGIAVEFDLRWKGC